jgi:hypothetical protein
MMNTGEHVSALVGTAGQEIYNEMRRSDAQISAVLKAITLPVIRNSYTVEPASDDPRDIEIAEFVKDNLFKRMSMTWRDTLRHILLMKPHGFMPMEKLWMKAADGRILLKKLDPRLPWSVDKWNYEGDTLKSIEQVGTDGSRYVIPIDKLVVFTENREGDNWEGMSALRAVYGMWKIKNIMLEIAAIKHDRHGVGVPIAHAPVGVDSGNEAWSNMEEALEDLHADEKSFLVAPYGWEVKLLEAAHSGGTDTEEFIDQLDHKIATALLAQFLQLGTTDSGNRALGESFIDFFLMSVQETSDYIAEVLTRFVVRELVAYNFDVDEYPTIHAARISEIDNEALAALVTAGVITSDIDVENNVRAQLGLPERVVEDDEEARSIVGGAVGGNGVQSTALNGAQIASLVEIIARVKAGELDIETARPLIRVSFPSIPEATIDQMLGEATASKPESEGRAPNSVTEDAEPEDEEPEDAEVEAHDHDHGVELAQIPAEIQSVIEPMQLADQLDTATEDVFMSVFEIREAQADRIITQIVGGRRVRDINVPSKKEMYDVVVRAFRDQVRVGRDQVRSEIRRQVPGIDLADPVSDDEFTELVLEELSLLVEGAGDKLKATIGGIALELQKAGYAGDALRAELDRVVPERIGERTWRDLAGSAVNQGWGHGRQLELVKVDDTVAYYYRSAILDNNVCSICRPKDGQRVAPGEPDFRVPDQECEGGPGRCRCLVVAVMNREEAVG